MFLVGSAAFTVDAYFQLLHRAARPAQVASDSMVVCGLAVFVTGRACFAFDASRTRKDEAVLAGALEVAAPLVTSRSEYPVVMDPL